MTTLQTFQSRFPQWEYEDNIDLYHDDQYNIYMTKEDIDRNKDMTKKEFLSRRDDEMKEANIWQIRAKIAENKEFWLKFVETKMMADQLLRNYDKNGNKILAAIDYISDCISEKTGKEQIDIIVDLENFIQDKLWYSIREKDEHKSLKRKLADMIHFHYNYNDPEDVRKALAKHNERQDKSEEYKAKEEREKNEQLFIKNSMAVEMHTPISGQLYTWEVSGGSTVKKIKNPIRISNNDTL